MKSTLENLTRDLAMKGYAERTQKRYLLVAQELMQRFGRPAKQITQDELRAYVEEFRQGKVSPSRVKEVMCALLFLYRKTVGMPDLVSFISLPKKYSPLPPVLSIKEVHALLNHIKHSRYRMLAMVMYGCGLRVSEAITLECRDIDGSRGLLYIRHGKGNVCA